MNGGAYAGNAGVFLVQTLFGLYILLVMLRFLLQWVRADFYNPLVQALVKITNPPLLVLRRYVPGLMGLDMAAIVLMLGLQLVELLLVLWIMNHNVSLIGLLVLAVAELLGLFASVFIWAVIIYAILSWINPDPRHPAVALLRHLCEPVLRPARGVLPPVSGLDLSPLLVIIGLYLFKMMLVAPLRDLGVGLL